MPPGGSWAKKSQILKGDDSGDPRQAVNVVQKFITKDKVLVIIGAELTGTDPGHGADFQQRGNGPIHGFGHGSRLNR